MHKEDQGVVAVKRNLNLILSLFLTAFVVPVLLFVNPVFAGTEARDAKACNGMVASAHPLATQVGVDILKAGGNAVDAAVAVGFTLGVVEPNASGLGGGGFLMIREAKTGKVSFIDFREKAPSKATADMFELDAHGKPKFDSRGFKPSAIGGKSVGVPGEVAGLLTALEQFGTMDRKKLIDPAIKYAEEGIVVSEVLAGLIAKHYDSLSTFPASEKIYLSDGFAKEKGERVVNPELANTLRLIQKNGRDAFYKGDIAKKIVAAIQADGGIMTMDDLADYDVSFRTPVTGNYRGIDIISAPPASSGGTHVIELLNIMENFDLKKMGANSAESIHAWAEAMKLMYADRAQFMADTDFVKVPLKGLTSNAYGKQQFSRIDMDKVVERQTAGDPWPTESGSTTHFSIIDKEGNMVACTKTINHFFGSGIVAPGTGVLLNDEMDDFDKRPGQANSIEAGKKPLSSMSPTLLMKDGKPYASLGTPGGKRIITTVALLISNLVDYDMNIQEAIDAARINNYEKGKLKIEGRIPSDVQLALKAKGHELKVRKDFDLYFGGAQGIVIDQKTGELHGGADPRRDGVARGY